MLSYGLEFAGVAQTFHLSLVVSAPYFCGQANDGGPAEVATTTNFPIRGCHAGSHANIFRRIGVETCSRTGVFLVRCRFGRGPDLYPLECRPMTTG